MAIAFSNLGNSANPDFQSATDLASYASSSWTPPTSDLILLFVAAGRTAGADTPTVSGNGLTWVQIGTTQPMPSGSSGYAVSLFAANASGSSAGVTTVSFGGNTQLGCQASFFAATGVDLSGGVAAAFVQSVAANGTGTAGSITLAAAGHADNRPISAFYHLATQAKTPRTNWTEADDLSTSSPARGIETQYRSDAFETTASATWASSVAWVGIAAELKAAGVAVPPTAPSGLTATAISGSRVDLAWVDNASDETGFQIEQSDNGTTGWALVASPAANATTASITGLPQNTPYYYRIRSVNADGNSTYSSVASTWTLLPGRAPSQPRMYLHVPAVVFAAQVNAPTPYTYPIGAIAYNSVTTGAYTAIKPGMTIILGTTAGADNLGRQRVRAVASPTLIPIGRSSFGAFDGELMANDNAYITIWDERKVWAKVPYIDPDGVSYKDGALAVEWRTTEPPPVAVMGRGFAGTVDATTGVMAVLFNGQASYAVADGATIVSYLWDVDDGTIIAGVASDDFMTATFPPGFRHVALTVTDSNGHSHTTERPVFADDADSRQSFDAFQIASHRITEQGQTLSVEILADMPRATYPDGTLAMIWEYEATGTAERDHMLIIGWLDTETNSMGAGRNGLTRDTSLTILDVAARLDMLPGFPQSIADDLSRDEEKIPAITWAYMTTPNLLKYIHYLMHWHSTALEVADFVMPDDADEYPFASLKSDGDSLWNQVDRRARAFVPDRVLTCDRAGRIAIVPDPMLAEVADRTAIVQAAIDENEWSDIRYTYKRSPRTHWLRAGAVVAEAWADLPINPVTGKKYIPTVFSIAPGDTPGQGLGEIVQGEQLALTQADLNAATGHRYARANAPLGMLSITLVQDDGAPGGDAPWREIEPAWKEWVTLTVSAETAARRQLTFTTARFLPKEISIRYAQTKNGLARTVELTLERETIGTPGKTVIKPVDVPPVGENPPSPEPPYAPVPSVGLESGTEWIAGIGSYIADGEAVNATLSRTFDFQTPSSSGGPTWEGFALGITDDICYSFVVDPFSPGYINQNGTGTINAWIATEAGIWRIEDMFGATPTATNVYTFTYAYGATSGQKNRMGRTIEASFGNYYDSAYPWLMVVTHCANTSGHTGTWATYSVDGGGTWNDVQITAHYDNVAVGPRTDIDVYLSPKTPGLAYTTAYTNTASPASVSGYVSTDWGATWSLDTNNLLQPGNRPSGSIHVPWLENDDELIVYSGKLVRGATWNYSTMKAAGDGSTINDISPVVSSKKYGPRRSSWGIRVSDTDPDYAAMWGGGNDTSTSYNDERFGLFVSTDAGATWTLRGATELDGDFPYSKGGILAFAGDDPNALYLWGRGPSSGLYITFSSDFGVTIDNRSGNLETHGTGGYPGAVIDGFVGIAGGPTA